MRPSIPCVSKALELEVNIQSPSPNVRQAHPFCSKINQGGGVAAPVASQVLGEVLPYLEVQKEAETEEAQEVEVPNLVGLTIKEAKDTLKEIGLEIEYEKSEDEEIKETDTVIWEQLPKKGVKIKQKNKVIVQINY